MDYTNKSTPDEIRARFDADVERFSNLHTGQEATMDAPLAMDLIARTAAAVTPKARRVLDVGCGAGNYTLKLLEHLPGLEATLLDLSRPMLHRAATRVAEATRTQVRPIQSDVRGADLGEGQFDIILAASVLHHLRGEEEWREVFARFFRALTSGGSLWIFDLVDQELPGAQSVLWARYDEHLVKLGGEAYRQKVNAYVAREDTPRSLMFQLRLLQQVGFAQVDVLHKNGPFAAFGAVKA